jgi:Ca-activated chloride channel homolog
MNHALTTALILAAPLAAQRTTQGLHVTDLTVEVKVEDGVASTSLIETIRNDGPRDAEADWILPLPEGAVADGFTMTVDGKRMTGEVLPATDARGVYERIVRQRQDPGLLEYMGRGILRARIFPIPAGGQVEVAVTYRHVLPEVAGQRRWSFPVRAVGVGGRAPEQVALQVEINSKRAIHNTFSPVAGLEIVQKGDHQVLASFEGPASALSAGELVLQYGLSDQEFGLDLLSTRADGDEEGTFLMLISPRRDLDRQVIIPRSITFVLDTSGSMAGHKIEQAREALCFFLNSLRPEDSFNVTPFSTEARPFFEAPVPATPKNVTHALKRADHLRASGGTNIVDALEGSLRTIDEASERVPILVFLTDGLPTIEEKKPRRILARARQANLARARVFVFGVGNDVNTHLLDTLAAENGGTRDYVRANEDIEVKTSELFRKLSRPVLTDLQLEVDGVQLSRVVPHDLPDLFAGGRLTVFGRYRGQGPCAIRLSGRVGDTLREYVYESTFVETSLAQLDFLPSLWAERRVGVLLDAIRLNGTDAELVQEVQRLGREHGIVTPYTSHLIVEQGLALGDGNGGRRGPGNAVPPGGGGGGFGGPSSPGPAGPASPGASARPRSGGPTTPGGGIPSPNLGRIAERLQAAGVLPADAAPAELQALARQVASELHAADRALRGLGRDHSGSRAVDDSAYLARLIDGPLTGSDDFFLGRRPQSDAARLAELFLRSVRDRVFALRAGVWTDDQLLDEREPARPRVKVVAFSAEYFELLRAKPALVPYFAFSSRLAVLHEGVIYEVSPAPGREVPGKEVPGKG